MLSLSLIWILTQRGRPRGRYRNGPGRYRHLGHYRRGRGPEDSESVRNDAHPAENEIVTLVDIDFAAYRRANDLRTVRKNVTLPSWLNDLAERNGVNFSQVLQESLKERLKVSNR